MAEFPAPEVYQDHVGEYRWRRVAANGELVADSGEGYVDKAHAVEMAARVNGVLESDVRIS